MPLPFLSPSDSVEASRSYVLVTGASMGIGEAFARAFARMGRNLVLVARSAALLQALGEELRRKHGIDVHVCVEDLSEPESPGRIYAFCASRQVEVELLVNCAGVSCAGDFDHLPLQRLHEIVMVNMVALANLTRLFACDMVQRKRGGVINVASLGGIQAVPGLGLYSATKSFVITLSEALHIELKEKGVAVVALCPGFIDTGFFSHSGHNAAALRLPVYGIDLVIKAALRGLKQNRMRVFPTALDKLLVFSQRMVTRQTAIRLAGFFAAVKRSH